MIKIKKAPRRSQQIKRMNYNTLFKHFGREIVTSRELELEKRYPVEFGKAGDLKRAKILLSILNGE